MTDVHIELPLSSVDLSPTEACGDTLHRYGLIAERQHQPPHRRTLPRWHVAYVHPALPPAHHPWPRSA
jgi:hypothetical protein